MNRELYIHTLSQFRDECDRKHMDTETEAFNAAIQALSADGDCISRQAAIDALAIGEELLKRVLDDMDVVGNEREKYEWGLGLIESYIADMKDLPSAQPEPHWIPCSERLPEEDGDYWVTADPRYVPPQYKSTDIILWSNGKWMMADYFVLDGEGRKMPEYKAVEFYIPIIAWMPLPEPWRGEEP